MKAVQAQALESSAAVISSIERTGRYEMKTEDQVIVIETEDVEIIPVDIPGWKVANSGALTVALDITLTDKLKEEGIARELVNRIQNIRKDKGFEVTDKINLKILSNTIINISVNNNLDYICSETLASSLELVTDMKTEDGVAVEVDEQTKTMISISKFN